MGVSREVLELIIKARDEATRDLEQTNAALDRLGETVGTIGSVIGGAMIVKGAWDLGQLAGAAGRVETSFRGMVGVGADKMLERLRASSQGTISDMDLMLSANRAMMLGVTKDAEQMARLLEVAAVRGQAMGLSTQQAFNDLMTGIGRASPLILDNLGIVTGGQKVYDDYAKAIGKATDALTEQEKKQALVSLVLDQGEGMTFTPDDASSWEQMSAALKDLGVSLGELLNETIKLPEAVSAVAKALDGLNDALERGKTRQDRVVMWSEAMEQALQQQADAGRLSAVAHGAQRVALEALEKAAWSGAIAEGAYLEKLYQLNPAAKWAAIEIYRASLRTGEQAAAASAAVGPNNALAGSLDEVADAAARAKAELAALTTGTWEDWMWDYASEIDAGLMEGTVSLKDKLDAQAQATMESVENWSARRNTGARLADQYGAKPATSGGGSRLSQAEQDAREWARTVKGAVESVFTASQPTQRDWWETNLGMYEDKPDEFLRRLRSAATEADSEWKHLLGGRTGDAANLYLAQQEELWRTGQWSQMGEGFDMGAAREAMVQAALAKLEAERAREAMIADIMSDPRLGGYSAGAREKVLGMGSEAGGATYAEAWVVGAVSVDAGREFTDAFGKQMEAQEARWRVFGSLSAGWMIDGMSNAAGNAANALVDVLFPGIYEELRRAGVVATP